MATVAAGAAVLSTQEADVLLIDNYDSFTYNLYQYMCELGASVVVRRNDQVTIEECVALKPKRIMISPGPGNPSDAGISMDVIKEFAGKVPIFGVCLGHRCIYECYGGDVVVAGEIRHGKTSPIVHDAKGIFEGKSSGVAWRGVAWHGVARRDLASAGDSSTDVTPVLLASTLTLWADTGVRQCVQATRYHSLVGSDASKPKVLNVTARVSSLQDGKGFIMGVRHQTLAVEGVQFHPESIVTQDGKKMISNLYVRGRRGGEWGGEDTTRNSRITRHSTPEPWSPNSSAGPPVWQ